jgi:hypothetical protein
MGNKPSGEAVTAKNITITDIQTEIDIEIKNQTENITNILNQTINDTSMELISRNAQTIEISKNLGNTLVAGDLSAGDDGEININQTIDSYEKFSHIDRCQLHIPRS